MINTFISCIKIKDCEYYLIMVRVLKTDVEDKIKAERIVLDLCKKYPDLRITFDMEDSDKILRVEGEFFNADDIIAFLKNYGNICVDLPIEL